MPRSKKEEVVATYEPFAQPAPKKRGRPPKEPIPEPVEAVPVPIGEELTLSREDEVVPLTLEEKTRLERYERIISRGIETFIEVGDALSVIAREKLYRISDKSFADYVARRWNWSVRNAYYLIEASETAHRVLGPGADNIRYRSEPQEQSDGSIVVVEVAEPILTLQESRELSRAPEDEQVEILEMVVEQVPLGQGRAQAIKEEVDRRRGPRHKTHLEEYSEQIKEEERQKKAREEVQPFDCPDIVAMRYTGKQLTITFRTGKRSVRNIWITSDELLKLWGLGGDNESEQREELKAAAV